MIRVECGYCGEEFEVTPYRAKQNKHHFCSLDCYYKWKKSQNSRAIFECEQCGENFEAYPSARDDNHIFCSRRCCSEWHRGSNHPLFGKKRPELSGERNPIPKGSKRPEITGEKHPGYNHSIKPRPCKTCGTLYRPGPWEAKHGSKFCSQECSNKAKRKVVIVSCIQCGKKLKKPPSYVRTRSRFLCSKRCEAKYKIGPNNPFYGKKHTEQTLKKLLKAVHSKPNQAEQRLIEIMQRNNFPFKYVGDGSKIITGANPDFIDTNGKEQIIELFGTYWHDKKGNVPWHKTEFGKVAFYSQLGYRCLVIWENELDDEQKVTKRIEQFIG